MNRRSTERQVAAFLALETEHGRAVLRGLARFFRDRPGVTVLKFSRVEAYDPVELKRLRLDGVIAKVGSRRDEKVLAGLGLPVVNISGQMRTGPIPTINSDDIGVGRMALRHFHSRGYRNFAYCGSRTHWGSRLRLRAFREEARRTAPRAGVATLFLPGGDQTTPYTDRARDALVRWVRRLRKPVGIFTFTDRMAIEVEEACRRCGLRVPDQVAILGVGNDLTQIDFAHVELSSIQLNAEQIGWLAAERLEQMMHGVASEARTVLVSPQKLITRRSTDRYAVADEVVAAALDHIRENLGNPVYVAPLARAIGVSRRVLEYRMQRVLGSTVNGEVLRLKFERAQELLADFALPIGEVAYRTGFGSLKDFSRAFSRRFGVAPSTHRRRLLGEAAAGGTDTGFAQQVY